VPLYEYQCKKCKHKFEKIQKFSARAIKKCPECGGPLEKIQHAPNVQFKGSGFYVNDYPGKKDSASSEGGSETIDNSSAEMKETSQGAKEAKEKEGRKDRDRDKDSRDNERRKDKDKDKDRDKDRPKDKDSKSKKSEGKKSKD
jgi:putative FmdB family regulatory protein